MTHGTRPEPDALGCEAFGHLASPFVDGELPPAELERFETHLGACDPCRRLTAEYRAVDAALSPPYPAVSEAQWDAAWLSIRAAIVADHERHAASPLARLVAALRRLAPGGRLGAGVQPLAWAAAAGLLVVVLLAVQRAAGPTVPGEDLLQPLRRPVVAVRPAPAAQLQSVSCQAPDYIPVVFTIDGDEPLTVVQCMLVGNET